VSATSAPGLNARAASCPTPEDRASARNAFEIPRSKAELIFAHVVHLVAPLAVGRSAANDEAHPIDDTIMLRNVNVNQPKASYY